VLEFDPGPDWEYHSPPPDDESVGGDSVAPSVSRSDAGLEMSDSEWGGDAVLVWHGEYADDDDEVRFVGQGEGDEEADYEDDEEDDDDGELEDEDAYEVHDIDVSDDDAPASKGGGSKVPDYNSWDIPKLQVSL
jgi:hypothetical protein